MKTVNPSLVPFFAVGCERENLPYFFGSFVISRKADFLTAAVMAMMANKPPPRPDELERDIGDASCVVRASNAMLAFGRMCHVIGLGGNEIESVKVMPRLATEEEIADFERTKNDHAKKKRLMELPAPSAAVQ